MGKSVEWSGGKHPIQLGGLGRIVSSPAWCGPDPGPKMDMELSNLDI